MGDEVDQLASGIRPTGVDRLSKVACGGLYDSPDDQLMERRRSQRTLIRHPGKILILDEVVHNCIVHNVTGLGICIELIFEAGKLPENIDFSFDNFRTVHRCKAVWSSGNLIGVAFEDSLHSTSNANGSRAAKLIARSEPQPPDLI